MKKIVISIVSVILLALIIWLIIPYYKTSNIMKKGNATAMNATAEKPYYSQLKFATSLLKQLHHDEPNGNIFYSPHSVYQVLLLAYFGVAGETEKQLKTLLGLHWAKSKSDVQYAYNMEKNVRANRFQDQIIEFNSIDKLYFSKDIIIRQVN